VAYATDAQFQARVPAVAALTADERSAALEDAEQEIDDRVYGGMTVRAHCMLAAHMLASPPLSLIPAGGTGLVTSRAAGEISVSFAAPPTEAVGLHSTTAYGREFDRISAKVGHAPLNDSTEPWDP
jgi:hypothetical protein